MAKPNPEVISLIGEPIFKEGQAYDTINPGHLIEFYQEKLRPQSQAQADCRRFFALENNLLGKGINDPYEANARVQCGSFHQGQEVYAKLPANAASIEKGDALEATGDGTLQKLTADGATIAFALEAKDASEATGETFIVVEVA